MFQNKCFFNIDFFRFFVDFGSQVEAQKTGSSPLFSYMGPKRRPRGPRRPQREDFERFWLPFWQVFDIIFLHFPHFFFVVFGFRSCTCPGSCASFLSLPFSLGGDIPRQLQRGACATSIRRSSQMQHGRLQQQAKRMN